MKIIFQQYVAYSQFVRIFADGTGELVYEYPEGAAVDERWTKEKVQDFLLKRQKSAEATLALLLKS